jgi:hypothetical protein
MRPDCCELRNLNAPDSFKLHTRTEGAIGFRLQFLIFLGLGLASSFVPSLRLRRSHQPSSNHRIIEWQNVSSRHTTFDEIKPVLVNGGQESIFLSRIYPRGFAQFERLSEATEEWQSGQWSGGLRHRRECYNSDRD